MTYKQLDERKLSLAPKLNKEKTRIDLTPLDKIDSKIRGLSSYPGAWTELSVNDKIITIKINKASIEFSKHESNPKNLLLLKDKIVITHQEGILICHQIQVPNKKRMESKEILNGNHLKPFFKAK